MAVRIITDTASDYELQESREKGFTLVPLSLTYGTENLLDGYEIDKETFYHRLLENKEIPMTSQPSPERFAQEFEKAKEAGDSVIAILVSSALSGTVQSALLAKQICEYDEIYIVDSLSAVAGMRILVEVALDMAKQGKSAAEIVEKLENLKGRIRVQAGVDTLEYLYKGGRLSRTEAGIGTLANIKPILHVTGEGKVTVLSKCIGRKKALRQLAEYIQGMERDTEYPAYYIYSAEKENCLKLKEMLESSEQFSNCNGVAELGPTIGTHVGGGAYGIAFIEK